MQETVTKIHKYCWKMMLHHQRRINIIIIHLEKFKYGFEIESSKNIYLKNMIH